MDKKQCITPDCKGEPEPGMSHCFQCRQMSHQDTVPDGIPPQPKCARIGCENIVTRRAKPKSGRYWALCCGRECLNIWKQQHMMRTNQRLAQDAPVVPCSWYGCTNTFRKTRNRKYCDMHKQIPTNAEALASRGRDAASSGRLSGSIIAALEADIARMEVMGQDITSVTVQITIDRHGNATLGEPKYKGNSDGSTEANP